MWMLGKHKVLLVASFYNISLECTYNLGQIRFSKNLLHFPIIASFIAKIIGLPEALSQPHYSTLLQ